MVTTYRSRERILKEKQLDLIAADVEVTTYRSRERILKDTPGSSLAVTHL